MNQFGPLKFGVLLMLSFALVNQVRATEIKAVFPGAMRTELAELLPQFEEKYGDKVVPVYGAVGAIVARLKNGDKADLVVVSGGALADLIAQGKIRSQGMPRLPGRNRCVHAKGAVKPDIGSVDAFRKALLSATAVAYKDPAVGDSSAIFARDLLERLGIAAEMKPRIRVVAPPEIIATVVRGDAEIGFDQMSNVAIDPRVGPIRVLPNGIQHYTNYVGGIVAESMQEESARALIIFLRSSSSQAAMKQKGFEPL